MLSPPIVNVQQKLPPGFDPCCLTQSSSFHLTDTIIQTCSQPRLDISKLHFAVKMILDVSHVRDFKKKGVCFGRIFT